MVYVIFSDRLGNNLFQFAAALSIDEKVIICACDSTIFDQTIKYRNVFFKGVTIIDHVPEGVEVYKEPFYHFRQIPHNKGEELTLIGYFQSYKYIDQEVVWDRFSVPDFVRSFIKTNYNEILSDEYNSVHVRRGDYLNSLYEHPVCNVKYYQDAIASIGNDKNYIFVSDDIAWCKKNFRGSNYIFVEDSNEIIDLFIPSFCKNNIISNSTFGWWGAFLNRNIEKIVIAPDPWFGFRNSNITEDLLPVSWTVIPNNEGLLSFCWSRIQFLIHHIKFKFGWK
jgi:hypothetical protein